MESIDVDDFAKQLIVHKCSTLIESEKMVPDSVLAIVRSARDEYFSNPSPRNYEIIKKLFSQTKHVDDSIDYKNFNRRLMVIALKFAVNKCKDYFPEHRTVIEVALKRLDGIDPDLKSSSRALLQHYNESLNTLDDPVASDEHHLIVFAKEIAAKMFIETIDVYSYTKKCSVDMVTNSTASGRPDTVPLSIKPGAGLLASAISFNRKRRRPSERPVVTVVKPLFVL